MKLTEKEGQKETEIKYEFPLWDKISDNI